MIRRAKALLFLGILGVACMVRADDLVLSSTDRILILAPHPDDEVLCCGGIIQKAAQQHLPIQIVFLTYGDNNAWSFTRYLHSPTFLPKTMLRMGNVRREESIASSAALGISSGSLVFLGYPDYGTLPLWNEGWDEEPALKSMLTHVRAVPYVDAYRPGAAYKGEEILQDLEAVIKHFRPTRVFMPHPADDRPDHRGMFLFARVALWDLSPDLNPDLYLYMVHFPDWPKPKGLYVTEPLEPPSVLKSPLPWIVVPLSADQIKRKYAALQQHRTQYAYSRSYLDSYVRRNELFALNRSSAMNAESLTDFENPDLSEWSVVRDGDDVVITGHLRKALRKSTAAWIALFGYRRDVAFKKMPKIKILFGTKNYQIDNQDKPIAHDAVRLECHAHDFKIRIALKLLGQPQKVLMGFGFERRHDSVNWPFVRVLEKI